MRYAEPPGKPLDRQGDDIAVRAEHLEFRQVRQREPHAAAVQDELVYPEYLGMLNDVRLVESLLFESQAQLLKALEFSPRRGDAPTGEISDADGVLLGERVVPSHPVQYRRRVYLLRGEIFAGRRDGEREIVESVANNRFAERVGQFVEGDRSIGAVDGKPVGEFRAEKPRYAERRGYANLRVAARRYALEGAF